MKKIIAITLILAAILMLSLTACGGDENSNTQSPQDDASTETSITPTTSQSETSTTPITTQGETSEEASAEPAKGTRSNPYQFGEDIVFLITSRGERPFNTTYTINFSELYIGEADYGGSWGTEYYPAIRATISVESEDDGTISYQFRASLLTDGMISYDIWEYHADDVLNGFVDGYYGGVTYNVVFRPNTNDVENPDEVNFAYIKIEQNSGVMDGATEIWIAVPETRGGINTPESANTTGFTPEEIQEIDAQLQGTWTVSAAAAEPVYVFNAGRVTVDAIISGISGGINTGVYEIGNDELGNGRLFFTFDNGVEGNLMLFLRDGVMSLIFAMGDNLYEMGKISDSLEYVGSFWTLYNFVDDFNQPTDEQYISNSRDLSGTFSNTATTNSRVDVRFLVYEYDGDLEIAMMLLEYGRNPVNNSSTRYYVEYDILMRDGDGNTFEVTGTMWEGGDRIFIDWDYTDYRDVVIAALSGSGEVAFRITQVDRPTTSYLFTVQASNFANLYQEAFGR